MIVKFSYCFVILLWIGKIRADCNVTSSREWGGLPATHVEYLPRPLDLVIIEHTATAGCNSRKDCTEIIANIQDNHMEKRKFWDIGYNFIVGGDGNIYEGTGWLHVGAHTYGYNRRSIGIAFVGNYNINEPKPESIEAVKSLIKCGVDRGHLKPSYKVVAHRQLIATESPGRKLYAVIRRWPEWLEDVSGLKQ